MNRAFRQQRRFVPFFHACRVSRHVGTMLVGLSLSVVGCGGGTDRASVSGEVTFEGTPVAEGKINFMPIDGTLSPTAGATITEGRFHIKADKGPKEGKFKVEIKAFRPTGKRVRDKDSGEEYDEIEWYIPDRYNRQSELVAEIKLNEKNELKYDLTND